MRKTPTNLAVVLFFCLLRVAPAAARVVHPAGSDSVALINVTVIDATGAAPNSNMTVVITGDRINGIGKTDKLKVPEGAQSVDASGMFLIPGLWEVLVQIAETERTSVSYT